MRRLVRAIWLIALIGGSDAAAAAGFDAAKIAEVKKASATSTTTTPRNTVASALISGVTPIRTLE